MLRLFVTVLPGLLPLALLTMGLSATLSVGEGRDKPISSRWRLFGLIFGTVAALVFAFLRASVVINQRNFVNLPALCIAVPLDIATIACVAASGKTVAKWRKNPRPLHISNAISALCLAFTVFYALPDVILQLTIFVDSSTPPFTSDMLLRALGFILGAAAAICISLMVRSLRTTSSKIAFKIAIILSMIILLIQHLTSLLQIMQGSILLYIDDFSFSILVWLINNAPLMIMAQICVFLIPAFVSIVIGFKTPVVGENPAQIRAKRAFKRKSRRSALAALLAAIVVILTLTAGVSLMNIKPTLTPPEPYELHDGVATINFVQISDGHLHRFQYKAKDGTVMRFIIIKKNGGAYGVGLDACENCGDAGYYEKDGKIICRKCDVAINLATIGFKGGCNPIPFPYKAGGGKITIHTADLDVLSSHFK
ncbi:Fe-S-containing protein [Gardnerella sp. Marseille-Q9181]|uniref:Fe-S-containing protein n=1 Tax=Gardnerella sp. Marseille-Q9181 TaxID=3383029 RepID=UPI003AF7E243